MRFNLRDRLTYNSFDMLKEQIIKGDNKYILVKDKIDCMELFKWCPRTVILVTSNVGRSIYIDLSYDKVKFDINDSINLSEFVCKEYQRFDVCILDNAKTYYPEQKHINLITFLKSKDIQVIDIQTNEE